MTSNLPPELEYGKEYTNEDVTKCSNKYVKSRLYRTCYPDKAIYVLESIDINLLKEHIDNNRRLYDYGFETGFIKGAIGKMMKLMDAYKNGEIIPPIIVSIDYGRIEDGNHRLYAQNRLGYGKIDVFKRVQ